MYCWTENVAKRASVKVVSCLLKFVNDVAHDWPELVLWSDTCGGQNRNVNMVAFLITLVNDDMFSINKVTQWFLWSGHSYLPSDADFSHIEKKKKDAMGMLSAEKYVQLMKNARRNKKFQKKIL